MPVRVIQNQVDPPPPLNSKQVCTIYILSFLLRLTEKDFWLFKMRIISARCVQYSPLQWLQIHGASEVQGKPVWCRGRATGTRMILQSSSEVRSSWCCSYFYKRVFFCSVTYGNGTGTQWACRYRTVHHHAVVGKLLLKSSWVTLLQLLVKVTRYF